MDHWLAAMRDSRRAHHARLSGKWLCHASRHDRIPSTFAGPSPQSQNWGFLALLWDLLAE